MAINIIALKINIPQQNTMTGDVIDVIDHSRHVGVNVSENSEQFVQIMVTDMLLDDPLVQSLRTGVLRLNLPEGNTLTLNRAQLKPYLTVA